ncbi:hypothetical protein [Salinimicrobium flavum]|uniref:Uncharacterized protein n=1 Tax=Salinimicrobium flavum TaxID=1737065 RepID=A0ABW5IW96_9FLAO
MSFHLTEGEDQTGKIVFPKHLLKLPLQEHQTIIHGFAPGLQKISIHPDTFLISRIMGERLKLLFAFGVPLHPQWIEGTDQCFTLVFESLPEDCEHFHFSERPDEAGGLHISAIPRSLNDVYWLPFIW